MNVETYERTGRPLYAAFAAVVASILRAGLKASMPSFRLQQISDRAKDVDSLRRKIAQRTTDPHDIERDIKDLAGCRIIFYTNADVTRFLSSGIIQDNFDVVEIKQHHPGRAEQDAGKLYIASHFVVRLKPERVAMPEYAPYAGLKCEVQVVTILNHTLAEIGHDIIYKAPNLGAFGERAIADVRRRMAKVMRQYIVPAGYELQQITSDFERVLEGKGAFDEGTLDEIVEAANNNLRYDALERLFEQVLPNFDDMDARYPGLLYKLQESALRAIDTPIVPIETPFESFQGKSPTDVLSKVADIIHRYWPLDPQASIDSLFTMYAAATTEEERKALTKLGEEIASHNMHAWTKVGPAVQGIVVDQIAVLSKSKREELRALLVVMLGEVLQPDIEGTTSSSHSITLHTGTVVVSDQLVRIRAGAIKVLSELVGSSTTETEYLAAFAALDNATRTPNRGPYGNDLLGVVLAEASQIVELHSTLASTLPFEVLRTREDRLFRLYRTFTDLPDNLRTDEVIVSGAATLAAAITRFRDEINGNREFVIYKTLVGFDSVFPPAWETGNYLGYSEVETYRRSQVEAFVGEVTEETKEYWYGVLQRCAKTRSSDLATFPAFGEFLALLGEKKPEILLWVIEKMEREDG